MFRRAIDSTIVRYDYSAVNLIENKASKKLNKKLNELSDKSIKKRFESEKSIQNTKSIYLCLKETQKLIAENLVEKAIRIRKLDKQRKNQKPKKENSGKATSNYKSEDSDSDEMSEFNTSKQKSINYRYLNIYR